MKICNIFLFLVFSLHLVLQNIRKQKAAGKPCCSKVYQRFFVCSIPGAFRFNRLLPPGSCFCILQPAAHATKMAKRAISAAAHSQQNNHLRCRTTPTGFGVSQQMALGIKQLDSAHAKILSFASQLQSRLPLSGILL